MAEENRKIKDAGVKIPFAKKFRNESLNSDMYSDMTDVEKAKLTKKANIWKTPDYKALQQEHNWTDEYTAVVKAIRDAILPSPALGKLIDMDDDEISVTYIDCINKLKEVCLKNNSLDELGAELNEMRKENTVGFFSIGKKYQFPWRGAAYKADALLRKGFLQDKEEKTKTKEVDENAWLKGYSVSQLTFRKDPSKNGYYVYKKSRGRSIPLDKILCIEPSETEEEAIRKAKIEWDKQQNMKKEAFKRPHLSNMGEPEYSGITPDDLIKTFGFRGIQFGRWLPDNERQIVLDHTYTSLMNLANIYNLEPSMISLGGKLGIAFGARGNKGAVAHYEPEQNVINLTRMSGSGALAHEWFHAFDKYLYNNFGSDQTKRLRYMTGEREENFENPKDIRLGRRMSGLNEDQRIALQKLMVTVFSKEDDNPARREEKLGLFDKFYRYQKLRLEHNGDSDGLAQLERERIDVENSIIAEDHKSDYYARSTDKKTMPSVSKLKYYGSRIETMARAFEAATDSLLKENNKDNRHLVSGVDDMTAEQVENNTMFFPYPIQNERKAIAKHMQGFIKEVAPCLQWKNTPEEVMTNKKIVQDSHDKTIEAEVEPDVKIKQFSKEEISEQSKVKEFENLSLF